MLLLLASALAQIVPTAPFTGEVGGGFEGFAQTGAALACLDDVMDGSADLCAPDATVGGIQVRDSLFLGCLLEARTGTLLAGSNDGAAELVFATPVTRFGAYMGTHADDGDVTIEAYDAVGTLLGSITEPLGGSCVWGWHGIETQGLPIARVRIAHSEHGGALLDLDDLEADTVCGVGAVDADGDGMPACEDCDDTDPDVLPGAPDGCNGIDDDCNGVVDDSPPGAGPASLQEGVCAGSMLVCGPDSLVDPDYTSIDGYEADETSCDGLDNDCDGVVDGIEGFPLVSDVGVCADIARICDGENGWVDPLPADVPGWQEVERACDGLDNDCDGEVDEELDPPASTFATGVCADMVKECGGADGWLEPAFFPPAYGPEICNGLDDVCNGEVDDDCTEPGLFEQCGCGNTGPAGSLAVGLALAGLLVRRRR